jgi:hypothetical protein
MSKRVKQADPLEPGRHLCARVEMFGNHSRVRGSSMNITTYVLDLARFPDGAARDLRLRWGISDELWHALRTTDDGNA